MESRSEISSTSEQQQLENAIPTIHVDQYLLDEYAHRLSSEHQSECGKSFPRIFTVAQTLKDPIILNHIKPDYGSLGQFIGDLNIGRDLLTHKKRKNESTEEQMEEKKIKGVFREKNQQELNNLFLSKSSSNVHRKVAGKLLVENLFKQSFGVSLHQFENQNIKQQPVKSIKFNLAYFDEIFEGKNELPRIVEEQTQSNNNDAGNNSEKKQEEKILRQSIRIWPEAQRSQLINQIKSKYPSFKKLEIKSECSEYKKLMPKTFSGDKDHLNYEEEEDLKRIQKQTYHVIQISDKVIHLQKLSIKPELILYFLSQFPLEQIKEVHLNQIRMSEESLCFMIDTLKELSKKIQKISIRTILLETKDNFALKIKELLESTGLRELTLEYLELQTKEFCLICLGVGSSTTLEMLNCDNNTIDERGLKSLQLVSKHCQNLKRISLKKNYLKPHHLSFFPSEAKTKILL